MPLGQDSGVSLVVRALTDDDAAASRQLGFEAFGLPSPPPPEPATLDQTGRSWYGAFDGDTLAARLVIRDFDACYGGAVLPTAGVAAVTVAAEYRGRGALGALFAEALSFARRQGASISTLFPTAPRIYRRFGYEVVAELRTVEVPTQQLASVPVAAGATLRTRRAVATDVAAIQAVYETWARAQNGPLTRRGVSFPATDAKYLAAYTGVTVAVDETGHIGGFAAWNRGQGYGEPAVLEVSDLLATSAAAYRALLGTLGSFSSVTYRTRLATSGDDLVRTFLPSLDWQTVEAHPYMLKILDVEAALASRRYPPGFSAALPFTLAGDFLAELDGGYRLEIDGGAARCGRSHPGSRILTPRGLALLYAGAQSCANLRAAGHLSGGEAAEDLMWDAVFGGRQAHIRNYF